jgi:molecular chaperone Hsp33
MDNTDVIARCVAASGAARVVVVIATEFAREAARRHGARGAAALAMGRAGAAGLLLATLTKGAERVTLQILGNGPLGALTVDSSSEGTARVFVGNPRFTTLANPGPRPRLGDAVGTEGMVSVIRDLGMRDTFNGRTPLVDGEIDSDVERYLGDSEQIDSTLGCEVFLTGDGDIQFAAGLLVQTLPGGLGTELVAATRARLRSGEVAETLSRRLAQQGAGEITTDLVAAAALGDDFVSLVQLGPSRPVRFHCPCSWERAASTLALLGEHELVSMIEEDGHGQVTCEFCRTSYSFTDENLDTIRRGLKPAAPPPS